MIISFTGAQSTGKTTLLKRLQETHKHLAFIPEVTRKVKAEYGVSINEQGDDITQLAILNQHITNYIHSLQYKGDTERHIVLDRCIVDGYIYTKWLFRNNKVSNDIVGFADYVYRLIINDIDLLIYTDPGDIPVVDDGERSVNVTFRNDIINSYNNWLSLNDILNNPLNILTVTGTVEERITQITQKINEYK